MYKVVYYLFPINDLLKLGSVAGPVIQANGRLSFEDDLRSGGLLYSSKHSWRAVVGFSGE